MTRDLHPHHPPGSVDGRRPAVALFLDPPTFHLEGDRLFDATGNQFSGDRILSPYAYVREYFTVRGIPVHTGDRLASGEVRGDLNVYLSLGLRSRWPQLAHRDDVVCGAFFALECPIVEPRLYRHLTTAAEAFRHVYSFSDAEALAPFLSSPVTLRPFRLPQSFDAVHPEHWARTDRRLLTMINANKLPRLDHEELYRERLRAIRYFTEVEGDAIDLYGVGWDVPPYRTGETPVPATVRRVVRSAQAAWTRVRPDPELVAARRAWRGPVQDKAAALARYDFAICYENMSLRGWITEKIFDCLLAGTIPVYLGDPGIAEAVPSECFVDARRFDGYPQLSRYLRGLGQRERAAMRDVGRDFIGSQAYRPFSRRAFAELLASIVSDCIGRPV